MGVVKLGVSHKIFKIKMFTYSIVPMFVTEADKTTSMTNIRVNKIEIYFTVKF